MKNRPGRLESLRFARNSFFFTFCSVLHFRSFAGSSLGLWPQLALLIVPKTLFSGFFPFYTFSCIFLDYVLLFIYRSTSDCVTWNERTVGEFTSTGNRWLHPIRATVPASSCSEWRKPQKTVRVASTQPDTPKHSPPGYRIIYINLGGKFHFTRHCVYDCEKPVWCE